MADLNDEGARSTEAEGIFAEYLGRPDKEPAFEDPLRAHPGRERELTQLHGDWRRMERLNDCEPRPANRTSVRWLRPSTSRIPAAGETLGPFRLVRELGRGGMGIVFEAEDTSSARRVALKLLDRDSSSGLADQRFRREARLAASISDPHCVFLYCAYDFEGTPAIAMERAWISVRMTALIVGGNFGHA